MILHKGHQLSAIYLLSEKLSKNGLGFACTAGTIAQNVQMMVDKTLNITQQCAFAAQKSTASWAASREA